MNEDKKTRANIRLDALRRSEHGVPVDREILIIIAQKLFELNHQLHLLDEDTNDIVSDEYTVHDLIDILATLSENHKKHSKKSEQVIEHQIYLPYREIINTDIVHWLSQSSYYLDRSLFSVRQLNNYVSDGISNQITGTICSNVFDAQHLIDDITHLVRMATKEVD